MIHSANTLAERLLTLSRRPWLLCLTLVLAGTSPTPAAPLPEAASIIGQPVSLVVQPRAIRLAGPRAMRQITVTDLDRPQPISFRRQFIAALNVGGCNQGACHGVPSGRGGFRLSLRGYDPGADYLELTRSVLGRRTDRLDPQASLIYLKGLG